jgi:hypothetical protein
MILYNVVLYSDRCLACLPGKEEATRRPVGPGSSSPGSSRSNEEKEEVVPYLIGARCEVCLRVLLVLALLEDQLGRLGPVTIVRLPPAH